MSILKDNTQIPKKVTTPAKTNNYSIVGIDLTTIFEKAKPFSVTSNKFKRDIAILSTELDKGVTIKAVETRNRRIAEQKLKDAKKEQGKEI